MSWGRIQILNALTPLGVTGDAIDTALRLEQASGTLPEEAFSLDDVSRLILALLAEGDAAEIDGATYSMIDVQTADAEIHDAVRQTFDEGGAGTSLAASISEIIELGLSGKSLVMSETWPVLMSAERVGVTTTPDGGCGWATLALWNGHAGADCAVWATAFFGEPKLAALISERSVSASALLEVGQRLASTQILINSDTAERPTVH